MFGLLVASGVITEAQADYLVEFDFSICDSQIDYLIEFGSVVLKNSHGQEYLLKRI